MKSVMQTATAVCMKDALSSRSDRAISGQACDAVLQSLNPVSIIRASAC